MARTVLSQHLTGLLCLFPFILQTLRWLQTALCFRAPQGWMHYLSLNLTHGGRHKCNCEHGIKYREKKKNRSKFVLEFWDRVRDKTCEFAASEYLYLWLPPIFLKHTVYSLDFTIMLLTPKIHHPKKFRGSRVSFSVRQTYSHRYWAGLSWFTHSTFLPAHCAFVIQPHLHRMWAICSCTTHFQFPACL